LFPPPLSSRPPLSLLCCCFLFNTKNKAFFFWAPKRLKSFPLLNKKNLRGVFPPPPNWGKILKHLPPQFLPRVCFSKKSALNWNNLPSPVLKKFKSFLKKFPSFPEKSLFTRLSFPYPNLPSSF